MKNRLIIIGFWIVLMLGAVFIIGTSLREEGRELPATDIHSDLFPSIPAERNVFSQSKEALNYQNMPGSYRDLYTYYNNRAFPGAPPTVPHSLISEKGIGGKTCLQCHQNGGYVARFEAYAPVTPHPGLKNCVQCHVPIKTDDLFNKSDWKKISPPRIRQIAMEDAPPMIPHDLQMRENCLACHAGPAAPEEIRVSHPERINCRQCHLPQNALEHFVKPPAEEEIWSRPGYGNAGSESILDASETAQISGWINYALNPLHE